MLCFGAVTLHVDQSQAHNRKTFRFMGTVRALPLTWLQCFASRLTKDEREDEDNDKDRDKDKDKDKDKEPDMPRGEGGAV